MALIVTLCNCGAVPVCPTDVTVQDENNNPATCSSPRRLPISSGSCPEFVQGVVTFSPRGVRKRKARIWIGSEAQHKDGPLVFYWHGTGMSPRDATWSIGRRNINEITCMGGIVVAPYSDPSLTYPWFLSNGRNVMDDFLVADEILACAIKKVGVDIRRIHSTGISAGGLMSANLLIRRANYIASVAPQSGGFGTWTPKPVNSEPGNKSSAILFHGGATDRWGTNSVNYPREVEKVADEIVGNGGFALLCNHGRGHTVPMDAIDSIWQFFKAHPWNTSPSPYAKGIPAGIPEYCRIH